MAEKGKKKASHAVLRSLLLAFISLVIGLSAYFWNAKNLVGNRMPMPFGFGGSVVLSGSMEPALSVGDLVFIKECEHYDQGDVVVYQSGDILVIHRIIKAGEDTVTTKGDANAVADDPIPVSDIKGKLIGKIPYAGFAVQKLKSPPGIVALLAVAGILLELSWRKERRDESKELDKIKEEIEKLKSGSE